MKENEETAGSNGSNLLSSNKAMAIRMKISILLLIDLAIAPWRESKG
jgi:hypothetical protein